MARKTLPLVGGFRDPDVLGVDYSIPVNMQPSYYEGLGDDFLAMVPSPGTARFYELDAGVITSADNVRGMIVMNGNIYAVFGNKLVELIPTVVGNELTDFTESELGTLGTNSGPVQMAFSNNFELAICDGSNLYSYIAAATVTFVDVTAATFAADGGNGTGSGFSDINDIDFLDNRFIFTKKDTNTFYVSTDTPFTLTTANNPATATDAALTRIREGVTSSRARVASLTARADTLKGIIVNNLNFYLFGKRVLETWTDAGVAGNPFRRINGQVFDLGCAATHSIAQATGPGGSDITVFLSSDTKGSLDIVLLGQGNAQSIANKSIQGFLADNVRTSQDAIGFMYREENDLYYQITFPTDNLTLVYDFERGEWHQREDLEGNRHRANCFVHFNEESFRGGYNFVGDYESRYLYQYNSTILTDADSGSTTYPRGTVLNGKRLDVDTTIQNTAIPIHKTYTAPYIKSPEERRVRISRVELNCVQGTGRTDYTNDYTEDKDPLIRLSGSIDKGRTYLNYHPAGVGKSGFYIERTRYDRLGESHDGWVFKLESFSRQPIIIISMVVDFEVGNE